MNKKSYVGTWEGTISSFIGETTEHSFSSVKQDEHIRIVINFQNGHFLSATKYNVKNLTDNENIKGIIDKDFETVIWNNKKENLKWELLDDATVKVSKLEPAGNKIVSTGILINKILS